MLTVFTVFGGYLIFSNIWATIGLVAFSLAVVISLFAHQGTKIEELEERIKNLEPKQ